MSFPSSSFRGLIVAATALGVGDEEKLRFDWALLQDVRDNLNDRWNSRYALLSLENGSRYLGRGSVLRRLLFVNIGLVLEKVAFVARVPPTLPTANRRSGMMGFAAAIVWLESVDLMLTKARRNLVVVCLVSRRVTLAGKFEFVISSYNFCNMTNSHSDGSINTRDHAERLDQQDTLTYLRDEFIIPTKADLKRKTLIRSGNLLPPPTTKVLTDVCGSLYD